MNKQGIWCVLPLLLALPACSSGSEDGQGVPIATANPGIIQGGDNAVSWTLTGQNFMAGATVAVNYTGVTVANVNVVSDTQLTFDLTANNAVVNGTAPITVTNLDGTFGTIAVPAVQQTITLSAEVQPIFTATCATVGCHQGGAPASGLNLANGATHGETVGVNSIQVPALELVNAGNPDTSYLVDKVEGTHTVGDRMPPGGALTPVQLALIRKWVEAGALNN